MRPRLAIAVCALATACGIGNIPGIRTEGSDLTIHLVSQVPPDDVASRARTWYATHGYTIVRDGSDEIVGERPLDGKRISLVSIEMEAAPEAGSTEITVYGRTDVVSGGSRQQASQIALETTQDVNSLVSAVQTRVPR